MNATTTKPTLNYRQQKIKHIVQNEKENGNDLTKKELIDKIRHVLDHDYQVSQLLKEKELREEEFRRIRKLHMDGKITSEEEEYLTQSHQESKSHNKIMEQKMDNSILMDDFQPNPAHTYRNKDVKKTKKSEIDNHKDNSKTENKERIKENEINEENQHETNTENENDKTDITEKSNMEESKETVMEEDHQSMQREKSELTLALENETSLDRLYELAEKMVFVSPKK